MNLDLSNKRALVCGSTSGIGRACAVELASLGCNVTLLARDAAKLAETLKHLPKVHGSQKHDSVHADLMQPQAVATAVAHHLAAHPGAYHIIINNTGGPPPGPAIDASAENLVAAFNAQLVTAHLLAQHLTPGMKAANYGRIINITSTSVKAPIPNLGISNIVRPAVAAWAKCLATELAPFGITVNNVLPGYTSTERLASLIKNRAGKQNQSEDAVRSEIIASIPAKRLGAPEELAAVVAFLASPAGGYVNGINVPVDGGRLQGL